MPSREAANVRRLTLHAKDDPLRSGGKAPRMSFIDHLNKWLTALQALAVVGGVVVALYQLNEIAAQSAIQSRTLEDQKIAQSATLILRMRDALDEGKYKNIADAIQAHDQKYKLVSLGGGPIRDIEVEAYIGNFEDIGLLVKESSLLNDMAYNHFSYDIEKAWCNRDVQKIIADGRKVDKSITASGDPIYGQFERLAQSYLAKEHQTCDDLDKQ
jgi:hypothetical protein